MLDFSDFPLLVIFISDPGDFGVISLYALIYRLLVD